MVKKLGLAIILAIFLISFVSSTQQSFGTFKLNQCINLKQICANCTYVNITSVISPTGATALTQTVMTKLGSEFSYNFCNATTTGNYIVSGLGDPDSSPSVWVYDFEVTATGSNFTVGKSITYILIFIFSVSVFVILLILGIALPSKNDSDEYTGYIIAVSNLKYFKMFCIALAYLMAMFISYFVWNIAYAYLDMEFLSNIMRFIFTSLAILVLPMFILITYILIANMIRDADIEKQLSRGFKVRK